MNFSQYTSKEAKTLYKIFKSSEEGLAVKEIDRIRETYGFNEVKAKEVRMSEVFLRQFKSPFFYLLFIAAVAAFLFGERIDGAIILLFVFINVFLGFMQEAKAEKAVAMLKKFIPLNTRVIRDGKEERIDKRFLVPGDMVLLEAGDMVPADLRLLKVQNFLIDESILSGESVPVAKVSDSLTRPAKEIFEATNMAFAGTSVISGDAEGMVIATGKDTMLGGITKMVAEINRESIYEKDLFRFCRLILRIVVLTIVFIFLANIVINKQESTVDFLIFSIALIVSIIPEALPLVVTFSLSEGSLRLAKEKVVVKRLAAIEDLGNVEILCTDKTGTLTENKLEMESVSASDQDKCLLYGLLTSSYVSEEIESNANPFDIAMFKKASTAVKESLKHFREVEEIPFDSFRMINSSLLRDARGNQMLVVKGAPENVLRISRYFDGGLTREQMAAEIEKEGKRGKRILAIAFKKFGKKTYTSEDEKDLNFLGYISFRDPLKSTAKDSVELAKKLGVQIKILTGDSKEVAGLVAKEIGLVKNPDTEVITGAELALQSEKDFTASCGRYHVFARISPETKYRIIEALQKKYEVGFLGEGVNDAPALKIANVAIAVEKATDVSKDVSDIILLDKDLRVIVDGIKQGRNIFSNVNKYIKSTLSSNFGNFYSIALISLTIPYLPMLPIQILLANLLTDFPLISIATDEVDVEELQKPKLYQLQKFIMLIMFLALTSTIFDFIFFGIFRGVEPARLQTLWFIESILSEVVLIFSLRTSHFFLSAKMPSLPLMVLSVAIVLITIFLPFTSIGKEFFHFVVPTYEELIIIITLILSYFILSEAIKLIYFRHWQAVNQGVNDKKHHFKQLSTDI